MDTAFPCSSMQHLDNGNCREIFQETCLQDKNVKSCVVYSGEKKEPYQLFTPRLYKSGTLCVPSVSVSPPRAGQQHTMQRYLGSQGNVGKLTR